jgi:FlaA1/EpsC-like NDP-sugar epimerase
MAGISDHQPDVIREIDWSGFLGRQLRPPDWRHWNELLGGKTVLITGAGGSIGSALTDLLLGLPVEKLVLVDSSASNLESVRLQCKRRESSELKLEFLHADILVDDPFAEAFGSCEPNIVFHTAGLKHLVPLESEPFDALKTNLIGTLRLLHLADCAEVEHFVHISSDKAVHPTSVLGVSKRMSELLVLAAASLPVHRISVRMGNVLGSSGSLVSVVLNALQNGARIPVTDPLASRFFVTAKDAAALLLDSLRIPESTLVVPEMGPPQKIVDLISFLVGRHDGEVLNHSCNIIGLRSGEKVCEQLTYEYEHLESTPIHDLYRIIDRGQFDAEQFADNLENLFNLVVEQQRHGLMEALSTLVPEFEPSPALVRYLNQPEAPAFAVQIPACQLSHVD